ncbi:Peroxisome size and maintenance regulator, partial [Coemansia thaxteri]
KLSGYTTPPMLSSLCSTAGSSTSTLMRRPHTVSVYENQRWWFGFGWIPRLGSNERAKWSDQTGKVRYASVNDFMPEDGYEWVDENSGWEVDRLWALPVHTDEDGWVYTDNFWKHPAAVASTVASYTRRRRWVRKVRPVSRLDSSRANSAALV